VSLIIPLVHDMGQNWELISDAIHSIVRFKVIIMSDKILCYCPPISLWDNCVSTFGGKSNYNFIPHFLTL
jgi:hypothetical protein